MVDISRIMEIKKNGAGTATAEDIPKFLQILSDFINEDAETQSLVKDLEMTISIEIEGAEPCVIKVKDGKSEFSIGKESKADFTLYSDIETITKVLIGEEDPIVAFLSGKMEIDGDFDKMIPFLENIELAYDKLGIVDKSERKALVDAKTMKKLYEVYMAGATDVDPNDIPLFFDIFTTFVNVNEEAQDVIIDEELRIQMNVKEIGFFTLEAKDGKMTWTKGKTDNPILEFEVGLKTAADVLLGGDAASAYLSGEVTASGNIAQALILQELLELFLELLPFTS
ncbi:MAG: SCP2 sterol-binding domain-containing protein [Promethearchaeota archaeon]